MELFRPGLLLLCLALVGCGGSDQGPPTYTVKGKVTLNSQPVKSGGILFKVGNHAPVGASIQKDGTYSISIPAGDAKVWFQEVTAMAPETMVESGSFKKAKGVFPPRYTTEASGLTYTVTAESEQTKDFALTGQ